MTYWQLHKITSSFNRLILCLFAALIVIGCGRSYESRLETTLEDAQAAGWNYSITKSDNFDVAKFKPRFAPGRKTLTIFLEGDGFAYIDRYTISNNPTPFNPIGLKAAIQHGRYSREDNTAYIARPCQFVEGPNFRNCNKSHWSIARFETTIIDTINDAVDDLKAEAGAQKIKFVGYSGGGAIAMQLGARRSDIEQIITIAGNIDHDSWTAYHDISPLVSSAASRPAIIGAAQIPQMHFLGEEDEILPPEFYRQIQHSWPQNASTYFVLVKDFDHHCCWVENWTNLLSYAQSNPLYFNQSGHSKPVQLKTIKMQ